MRHKQKRINGGSSGGMGERGGRGRDGQIGVGEEVGESSRREERRERGEVTGGRGDYFAVHNIRCCFSLV